MQHSRVPLQRAALKFATMHAMDDVTHILNEIAKGNAAASEKLLPLLYDELRRQAARQLAHEKPGQTLQATALVHEAYLRLVGPAHDADDGGQWNSRGHFFSAAAEAMRRILVEQARRKLAQKRGGDFQRVEIEVERLAGKEHDAKLLDLDLALAKLEQADELKAQVVKLRFFAGMTIEQTACALGISTSSVDRYWTYARAWLQREMQE